MNLKRIHEPSSGGMGTKLKMAKIILMCTMKENIKSIPGATAKNEKGIIRISSPKTSARAMFDKGPAIETFSAPHF